MSAAVSIVKALRGLEIPEDNARELRALYVAQACAFQVPLEVGKSASEQTAQYEGEFLRTLNGVNDYLPVDTKLARSLFERLLAARYELLTRVQDTALLKALLTSETLAQHLNTNLQATALQLANLRRFGASQRAVADSLPAPVVPA